VVFVDSNVGSWDGILPGFKLAAFKKPHQENSHEAIVLTLAEEAAEGGSLLLRLPYSDANNVSSLERLTAALKFDGDRDDKKFKKNLHSFFSRTHKDTMHIKL
jgi:hypothetical protein